MIFHFDDLHQITVRRNAADVHSGLLHLNPELIAELITMAVTLIYFPLAIGFIREGFLA